MQRATVAEPPPDAHAACGTPYDPGLVSDRPSPVRVRTVLERSAENLEDLLLNTVGVNLVLEEA